MTEVQTLEKLFELDPILAEVDKNLRADDRRKEVLKVAPRNGVGVEIGVFTGRFSEILYEVTKPSKFYLVDVWHKLYRETYPDWGKYTAGGTLTTASALDAVRARAEKMNGAAEIVIENSVTWLTSMPPHSLDWAYIDSSHSYAGTYAEIEALLRVLKPAGVIMGDDCFTDPLHKHHGVFRAVRDHAARGALEVIWLDGANQWAMRRRSS